MDSLQLGRIDGQPVFARHERPYGGDPHTTARRSGRDRHRRPYKTVRLRVDDGPTAGRHST